MNVRACKMDGSVRVWWEERERERERKVHLHKYIMGKSQCSLQKYGHILIWLQTLVKRWERQCFCWQIWLKQSPLTVIFYWEMIHLFSSVITAGGEEIYENIFSKIEFYSNLAFWHKVITTDPTVWMCMEKLLQNWFRCLVFIAAKKNIFNIKWSRLLKALKIKV